MSRQQVAQVVEESLSVLESECFYGTGFLEEVANASACFGKQCCLMSLGIT